MKTSLLPAWIGTLPAVCRFFGTVPVVGLAVNVLVLPLFAFLIVPAFAAIALSYAFLPLGRLLAAAPALLLKGLIAVIDAAAGSMAAVPAPGYAALGLWMLSLLAASKLFMAEKRTRAIVSLALLAASLLVWRI